MTKSAGEARIEDMFKEPVRPKELAKEEAKCEDFSLILAKWKAQIHPGIKPPGTGQRKEQYMPKVPLHPGAEAQPVPTDTVPKAQASVFWEKLKTTVSYNKYRLDRDMLFRTRKKERQL